MATAEHPHPIDWERYRRPALIAGGVGVAVFLVVALLAFFALEAAVAVFRSYLVVWAFLLGISLGCLVVVMLQYLTGGNWGIILRRTLESGMRTLPLLAALFLPLLFGLGFLYEWTHWGDDEFREHPFLKVKHDYYLNIPFFIIRAVFYFAVWLALAHFLSKWSREQDRREEVVPPRRFRLLSAPGIVLYGLTITFASIDWIMSLNPEWISSIFGVLIGMGQVLSGFSFAVAAVILLSYWPPLSGVLSGGHLRDLGSLLLAFVMVWAYLSFSQFLLIWYANLPEETPWYIRRLSGGWQYFGLALILFHFALPFCLLLSADVKRNRRTLAAVAGLVLVMRLVDLFWLIVPAQEVYLEDEPLGVLGHWLDVLLTLAALVGLGGLWLWFFLGQLRQRPLLPPDAALLTEGGGHG